MKTAVVGSGMIGLLSAWELRRRGHRVTIISPEVGEGASRAAAGMLAPVSEVQYGQDRLYPLMMASREMFAAMLETLARATEKPLGYRENGTILVGATPSDLKQIEERAEVQRSHGMEVSAWGLSRLRRAEPALSPSLAGGYAAPHDVQVDPRLLMAALWDAVNAELSARDFPEAAPAVSYLPERVTRVEQAGASWSLTLGDGTVHAADRVLLAPGLGYGSIRGVPEATPLRLRAIHGDILRLRVPSDRLAPGEEHLITSTIRASVYGRSVYLVPRSDGGLVIGASVREDGHVGVNAGCVHELLQDAISVVPGVREAELVETLARARPGTPDDIPYLGRVEGHENLVVSTGYSRHGVLLAPLGASLAADLLDGLELDEPRREQLRATSPHRFTASESANLRSIA